MKMIIGHERIWRFLTKSVQSNRLAHAYLFVGAEGLGKKKVAFEFAKILQCEDAKNAAPCDKCKNCISIERNQHPDVLLIEPGGGRGSINEIEHLKPQEIKIEQIRALQHQVNLSPYSGRRKIVIIDSADQMTQEAVNCLLKTLEEPPQKSVLILISSSWQRLLPTIISRCQLIKFLPVKTETIIKELKKFGIGNKTKINQAVRYACGRPGVAVNIAKNPQGLAKNTELIKELQKLFKKDLTEKFRYAKELAQNSFVAQEILDQWVTWLRDLMLESLGKKDLAVLPGGNFKNTFSLSKISETIKNIYQSQRLLQDNSLNPRLILENLMIKI